MVYVIYLDDDIQKVQYEMFQEGFYQWIFKRYSVNSSYVTMVRDIEYFQDRQGVVYKSLHRGLYFTPVLPVNVPLNRDYVHSQVSYTLRRSTRISKKSSRYIEES
jgi:hypothetical protein